MKEVSKKILPEYFKDVKSGIKTFEVRKDEDDIQVGDILILEEWKPDGVLTGGYTGSCIRKKVKYVLRDIPQYGLEKGYCIIGLENTDNGWILTEERLPDNNRCVLIKAESTTIAGGTIIAVGACHNGFWFVQSGLDTLGFPCNGYKVVEWRELPKE